MNSIDEMVEQIFLKEAVAGLSVAVTDRKGTLFSKDYGVCNCEVENSQTPQGALYRIASVSKTVTALTVMKLVEDGSLSLDVPVKTYLPDLQLSDSVTQETVTLRHLLSHTSGLPGEYEPDGPRDEHTVGAFLAGLEHLNLMGHLGEEPFCYCNWGFRLAVFAAQDVTGELFSRLATQCVLMPLQMCRTFYDPLVALTYPVSLPHIFEDGSFKVVHKINENAWRYAAGGLFSNTEDVCKLARMFLNKGLNDKGERVFRESTVSQMTQSQVAVQGEYIGYGLGMMLFEHGAIETVGHLGSHPPYASSLMVDKGAGLGVVTLMNTYRPNLRTEIPVACLKKLRYEENPAQ